ncbi:MAG: ACP S-malonyltransferase [Pseudomonadota bacterium]|nr:ACP S-malonyltransferase [Pseudomonadota bacterium]MEC8534941.1 ACP S-malonyltransferase [Pseudomonadota bacterium]
MSRAIIFPGQGSQSVGMGRGLASQYAEAREVFEAVDDALGEKLSAVIWNGPDEELTLTENAQPALMAVSLATFRVLENQGFKLSIHADYVAGHSLGEYSALAASGALTLADTAKLLRIRGKAMQQAVPVGVGAMAALLGPDFYTVVEIAAKASTDEEICSAANDNAPGQVVISGSAAAVARAIDLAKEAGAKRAVELPVSAPFHCSLMSPAADAMRDALADVEISAPQIPIVTNVTAASCSDPEEIRSRLVEQVTGSVRWRESVEWLCLNNVTELVEVGSGKVLTGLARRINRELVASAINEAEDVDAFIASLT